MRSKEKRRYPRIEAKVQVAFRTVAELVTEYTKNISKGGIFLKTDKMLDPNAQIELKILFPGHSGEFLVMGRVVRVMSVSHPTDRSAQIYGAGIRFIDPVPELLQTIERIIEAPK